MIQLKRHTTILLISILILCGIVFGVVICEIGLRIAGIEYPYFVINDDTRGWAYQPGVSGWNRREGESYVQINSKGFFDQEHTKVKPENTFRIALIGDSFVDAQHVPFEQGFASVIEQELSQSKALSGKNVEVIKFAVSGYGTDQELITLRQQVWDYAPDIVILSVFTQNDIVNVSQVLEDSNFHSINLPRSLKPYFVLHDSKLVLDQSFLDTDEYHFKQSPLYSAYAQLKQHSRLVQVLLLFRDKILREPWNVSVAQLVANGSLKLEDKIYQQPSDPTWEKAWQVTEELIRTMHHEVISKGAEFLVVTLSNPLQALPDSSVREKAMQLLGVSDLFYPDRRIKALGDRQGFPVLNLAPSFQSYAEENNICLHGFDNAVPCGGHWNAQGHQLAGKMIAEKISKDLNIKKYDLIKQKLPNNLTT